MHGGVGLGGLSIPNGLCSLCMSIYFKPWGIKKYPVPYIVQIELTYISIKCGIVNFYVDGFLNSSGNAMVLPPYYLKVVLCGSVASDATVVMYRGGFLQVFSESFSKGPKGLSYIFLIICQFSTLEPVDGPTFVFHWVLILRGNLDVLMVLLHLKSVCMTYLLQIFCFLDALT